MRSPDLPHPRLIWRYAKLGQNRQIYKNIWENLLTNNNKYNILYLEDDNMNAITYTDLRQNLKTYMDKVFQDNDPLIITRKNSENVVLISIDEYNSLMETNYLLSNEANSKHLKKSITQHKSGKIKSKKLYEYE
jgi:antitoxin YefM